MSMSTKHTTAALLAAGTGIALLALGAVTEAPSAAAFASNSAEATARGARADPGPAPVPSAGCGVEQTPGNDERSNAVLFLGSDEASFITGETIVIDGGTLNT